MNHREKKRKLIITTLSVICIAVLSLTIAYAALSESLTISGSGTVSSINWDISIANSTNYTNKAIGGATFTTPIVNGTTISYSVNVIKPGDGVTLYFDVINNGDINGEISSIVNQTPTCTSSTGNTSDASLVCNNLEVSMEYASGYSMSNGDVINTTNYTCRNGYTEGFYKTVLKVDIKLKDSMTSVPGSTVTISNMKHDIIYVQSDKTCKQQTTCFVAGTKVLTENGYKPIENIEVGESVYALNEETNQYELNKVLQRFDNESDEIYEITVANQIIKTTRKHKFYIVDKGWIQAGDLVIGDKISSKENIDTTITKIEVKQYKEKIPVYNMEVEGHHNYLITEDNLLVHNAGSAQ